MVQRLDLKTLRYDRLGRSVLIDGRKVTVEISHEALETFTNRKLTDDEAMYKVAEERIRFTKLAEFIPADDGKIHITTNMLMNNGLFESGEAKDAN